MTDVTIISGTTEGEVVDDEIELEHDEDVSSEEINNILKDS